MKVIKLFLILLMFVMASVTAQAQIKWCLTCQKSASGCPYNGNHPECKTCRKAKEVCPFKGNHPLCVTCGILKEKCKYRGKHPKDESDAYMITVSCNITNAVVSIDGVEKGSVGSPFSLSEGKYKLKLTAKGYADIEKSIVVDKNNKSFVLTMYPIEKKTDLVDLGLSVKWATCNVGASSPEETGGYYAWGEFKEKDEYTIETYAYTYKEYGYTEARKIASNISGTKYDAATKIMGKGYRIPTKEEMKELIRDCTWSNKVFNGVLGFVVTGKTGNSIFIPCVGSKRNMSKDGVSYYWTSTANEYGRPYSLSISAYVIFGGEVDLINYVSVVQGLPIRAVSDN